MDEMNDSLRKLLAVLKETNEIYDKFVRQASSTIEEIRRFREGRDVHADDTQPHEDGGAQSVPGSEGNDRGSLSESPIHSDASPESPVQN